MANLKLLTRADDAGLNRTTNRAIRASVKQGIVKNVSLLANAPKIEDAAELLHDLSDMVDFGLHVCLAAEWTSPRYRPIAGSSGLTRADGSFPATIPELAALEPSAEAVAEEVAAQYERLCSLGFNIAYVDEHMLSGSITEVRDGIVSVASRESLIYDRELAESAAIGPLPNWTGPGPHPGTELADHLSATQPGTYLLVGHPGFKADEMQHLRFDWGGHDDILQQRSRERRMFADIEIVDYCENAGITLLRYTEVRSE